MSTEKEKDVPQNSFPKEIKFPKKKLKGGQRKRTIEDKNEGENLGETQDIRKTLLTTKEIQKVRARGKGVGFGIFVEEMESKKQTTERPQEIETENKTLESQFVAQTLDGTQEYYM
jgi:hypothetical protein